MDAEQFNQKMNVDVIFKITELSKELCHFVERLEELSESTDKFKEEVNTYLRNEKCIMCNDGKLSLLR